MIGKNNSVYIGATTQNLRKRLSSHKHLALRREKEAKKHHEINRLRMPKYEIICRTTGKQIGVFQGYKHVSEKLGYHQNTVRVCLSRGYPTRKYIFRYMEV